MRTILAIFISSFIVVTVLTPVVILVARRFNLVDQPSARKIHPMPIPRIGGVSIFIAFFIGMSSCLVYKNLLSQSLIQEPKMVWLAFGSLIVFGLGLIDDIWRLGYLAKFSVQIFAGLVAYIGGFRIDFVTFFPQHSLVQIGLSLPVTIFWVVLVINAINLIDGLDGLAAGVGFLVSTFLLILCLLGDRFVPASVLAALAGALLGFLIFNSNPASIFMGDSGSYFIGFIIASVSMIGSFKGQTAASILIPMIALGLPLMETIWSALRRFIYGQRLFKADRDHIHHRLMAMGLTQRNAVAILYGVTVLMGCFSIAMVYTHDNKTALLFLIFAAGVIAGIQKLGYFDFFRIESFWHWLKDVSDETGISRERRNFLNFQMAIRHSKDIDSMWNHLSTAVQWLHFDFVELRIENQSPSDLEKSPFVWWNKQRTDDSEKNWDAFLKRATLMKLELPLASNQKGTYGILWLVKDLSLEPLSHYTLRRIEHLRRTVIKTLETISRDNSLSLLKKDNI